jgi:hypothetical protein
VAFKSTRRLLVLDFAGTALDGLTVRARPASMGRLLEIAELENAAADPATARAYFAAFAEQLVEWDWVDDDDQPVPLTAEGLLSRDPVDVQHVIRVYMAAVRGTPAAPLSGPSSSGAPEPSLPMEPLPASPPS